MSQQPVITAVRTFPAYSGDIAVRVDFAVAGLKISVLSSEDEDTFYDMTDVEPVSAPSNYEDLTNAVYSGRQGFTELVQMGEDEALDLWYALLVMATEATTEVSKLANSQQEQIVARLNAGQYVR